ncbi:hypothetical protein C7S18_01470 [Ahniella affigens]|uniref:VCBS repeat-containing protein n=1 Tax=Ahniella affigens TaxID=2021234 RepID=A0A2P1PM96_9GAMM|nr:VCBS repeat-containing protein [Ahniella affigens]AVP95947.1 hypothetical protein C7S18_01470 [Ahniella affigens]
MVAPNSFQELPERVVMNRCIYPGLLGLALLLSACTASQPNRQELDDPNRTWIAEDGREYRLERLEKRPDTYQMTADGRLRWYPGGTFDIERETDDAFYVRQYAPVPAVPPPELVEPTPVDPAVESALTVTDLSQGLPTTGQWRDHLDVVDLNGDQHLDLLVPPIRKSFNMAPEVFLGQADGHWQRWDNRRFPTSRFDYGAAASADINGDGHADVAVGMHILGIRAFLGDGAGTFTEHSQGLPVPTAGQSPALSSRQIAFVDWNQDRMPDLVVLNERLGQDPKSPYRDGAVVFSNLGDHWQALPTVPALHTARVMAQDAARSVLLLSAGTVDAGQMVISERHGKRWTEHVVNHLLPSSQLTAMAVTAGKNGADRIALAYQSRSPKSWWLDVELMTRTGRDWQRQTLIRIPVSLAIRDLHFLNVGTDHLQLAAINAAGQIEIWSHRDKATWVRHAPIPVPEWRLGCAGFGLHAADLDADGRDELIANVAGDPPMIRTGKDCTGEGGIQVLKLATDGR